ncbi:unnamed protein product, partial [Ectocarpus fasciculatus]
TPPQQLLNESAYVPPRRQTSVRMVHVFWPVGTVLLVLFARASPGDAKEAFAAAAAARDLSTEQLQAEETKNISVEVRRVEPAAAALIKGG